MIKTDTAVSSPIAVKSSLVLEKLRRIKTQFRKDSEQLRDTVSLTKPQAEKKKSGKPQETKKPKNILRERIEAKKKAAKERGEDGFLTSGGKRKKSILSGGSLLNQEHFGNIAGMPGGSVAGTLGGGNPGTFGSGNPTTLGSGNPNADMATASYEPPVETGNVAMGSYEPSVEAADAALEAKFEQIEAESKMQEETERIEEQVAQQQEQLAEKFERDQQQAMMAASYESPEEAEFAPTSDTTNEVTARELEEQVEEAVQESLGDGQEATNEMMDNAEQTLETVQAETSKAREKMAKEAPKFSQDLNYLMEQYAGSDSRQEQEMIQRELEGLLDGAGDGLATQVEQVRGQLTTMFEKSSAIWDKREAAQELQLVSADRLAKQRSDEKRPQSDSEFLKKQTKKKVFHDAKASGVEALSKGQGVQKVLREKGVVK